MRLIFIAFAVCSLTILSCNSNKTITATNTSDSSNSTSKVTALPAQSKLSEQGTQSLMLVITRYYELKDALVATKADKAFDAATNLALALDSLHAIVQKDSSGANMKPYIDTIVAQNRTVLSVKDESCERQRIAFGPLSSAMYGLLKQVQLKHVTIYQEYCPMAFNEKGAHWLSDDSDIKNPYFGKKMIECGEVTDVIK